MKTWELKNLYKPLKLAAFAFLLRLENLEDDANALSRFVAWTSISISSIS